MPVKKFIEADYKDYILLTGDMMSIRHLTTIILSAPNSIFHQIKLTRNSLTKLFPEKKRIINNRLETESYENNEEMVLKVLEKF